MSLILPLVLSFDPALGASADTIPDQVPSAVVIESHPIEGRVLRGDHEVPDMVMLVYTSSWWRTVEDLGEQVVESGGRLALVREVDSSSGAYARFLHRLGYLGEGRVEGLSTVVDTAWVRDWGPIQSTTRGGKHLWLDADYDDDERERDDLTPPLLGAHYRAPVVELPWVLDGGAFISNGAGLCALTLEYVEESDIVWADDDLGDLLAQLGCRATALIPTLVAEPTKHADMIAQFVGPKRVMIAQVLDEDGESGEDGLRLAEAEAGLRRAAAVLGLTLEVVHVPTPPTGVGLGYSYSYVNGLRLRDRYLMPSYVELDARWELWAWNAVQEAHGDVPVVPVIASELISSGGAIHCAALGLFR